MSSSYTGSAANFKEPIHGNSRRNVRPTNVLTHHEEQLLSDDLAKNKCPQTAYATNVTRKRGSTFLSFFVIK
jgi:hypothetical protein